MTLSRSPRVAVAPGPEQDRASNRKQVHRTAIARSCVRRALARFNLDWLITLHLTRTNSPLMLPETRGDHAVAIARSKGDPALHGRRLRFFDNRCLPRVLVPPDPQGVDRFDAASAWVADRVMNPATHEGLSAKRWPLLRRSTMVAARLTSATPTNNPFSVTTTAKRVAAVNECMADSSIDLLLSEVNSCEQEPLSPCGAC
jgi:hypothetical protein